MTIRTRIGAALAATTLLASGTIATTTTTANAATISFKYSARHIDVYINGRRAGYVHWFADQDATWAGWNGKGDTMLVADTAADGWGLEGYLNDGSTLVRTGSTQGHDSPYYDNNSGNLPEGHRYTMTATAVKGSTRYWSNKITVTA